MLTQLAENLGRLDPKAAHALLGGKLFTTKERLLAAVLAPRVKKLEEEHPGLKESQVGPKK